MVQLTRLEETLRRDADAGGRDDALARLALAEQHWVSTLRTPLTPDAYAAAQAQLAACRAAATLIAVLWRRYHAR